MFSIKEFEFNKQVVNRLDAYSVNSHQIGENWPIVYVLNNKKEAYVGETLNAARRAEQHLKNPDRARLSTIRIISDEEYNKSVILDLESYLIKHMGADGKFELQNGNGGIQDHDYYDRKRYEDSFVKIWDELRKLKVVEHTIEEIENSEMFKYSPYKSLGPEQVDSEKAVISALVDNQENGKESSILISGGAGTGKTILAIYLLKLLADISATNKNPIDVNHVDLTEADALTIYAQERIHGIDKIGIVIPQKSLRTTLKDVFKHVQGLDKKMVYSPSEAVDEYISSGEKFDLLIVDEAHRLKCRYRGHLSQYPKFDSCSKALNIPIMEGNELEWLMLCSRNQILFRDELQTVRPCDVTQEDFERILFKYRKEIIRQSLSTQWRCQGGNNYINYVRNILSCVDQEKRTFEPEYEFKLYDDIQAMIDDIKSKDRKYGLCRIVAGYAWYWYTKPSHIKGHENDPNYPKYDIEIQGHKYKWNSTYDNWITSANAVNEIGCIHTSQGYDLNYVGVIIGEDVKYDPIKGKIYADKNCYFDQQGKSGVAEDQEVLKDYLTNIYLTLMTRGVKGAYVYVCDDNLREYMSKYIERV